MAETWREVILKDMGMMIVQIGTLNDGKECAMDTTCTTKSFMALFVSNTGCW